MNCKKNKRIFVDYDKGCECMEVKANRIDIPDLFKRLGMYHMCTGCWRKMGGMEMALLTPNGRSTCCNDLVYRFSQIVPNKDYWWD